MRTSSATLDCVGIGETMLTLFPDDNDAARFRWDVGGAESNVVRYLSKAGHRTRWISHLGTGPLGARVAQAIAADGVDMSKVQYFAHLPTGLMLKDGASGQYYRHGSAASKMSPQTIDIADWGGCSIVHTTGITLALSETCTDLVRRVLGADIRALRSFDVNWRASLWNEGAARVLQEAANLADVVFVGLDEAETVWGTSTPEQVRLLLPEPKQVVVKDGERGAYCDVEGVSYFEPALQGSVVDLIGAGDAFAAGYLSGLLRHGDDIGRCLRLGHIFAMTALRSPYDVGVLPSPREIEGMLNLKGPDWKTHVLDKASG